MIKSKPFRCKTQSRFNGVIDTFFKKGYRWMNNGRNYTYWNHFKENTIVRTYHSVFCGEKYLIFGT